MHAVSLAGDTEQENLVLELPTEGEKIQNYSSLLEEPSCLYLWGTWSGLLSRSNVLSVNSVGFGESILESTSTTLSRNMLIVFKKVN